MVRCTFWGNLEKVSEVIERMIGMNIQKADIKINLVTMNILDTYTGNCVISEEPVSHGDEIDDFLKNQIFRLFSKDDVKKCEFKTGAPFSQFFNNYQSGEFSKVSQSMGKYLYGIMEKNSDIPAADVFIVEFSVAEEKWIAVLKANYKTSYGHIVDGRNVDIAVRRNIIPYGNALFAEAAAINTVTGKIHVAEKKYHVNGVLCNYFSSIFLQCRSEISDKAKATIVRRSINNVVNKYYDSAESTKKLLELKGKIAERYEEEGVFNLVTMGEEVFDDEDFLKNEFNEKLDKYEIRNSQISPLTDSVKKILCMQEIVTETGIKITIPLDKSNNKENIEFSPLHGGSIIIKNVGNI